MTPPFRSRARSPYAKAVLGVRLRTATTAPRELKLTLSRRRLMEGVNRGEVRKGTGRYMGGYRWHHGSGFSETVTAQVLKLMAAQWAADGEHHVELTEQGRQALGGAP